MANKVSLVCLTFLSLLSEAKAAPESSPVSGSWVLKGYVEKGDTTLKKKAGAEITFSGDKLTVTQDGTSYLSSFLAVPFEGHGGLLKFSVPKSEEEEKEIRKHKGEDARDDLEDLFPDLKNRGDVGEESDDNELDDLFGDADDKGDSDTLFSNLDNKDAVREHNEENEESDKEPPALEYRYVPISATRKRLYIFESTQNRLLPKEITDMREKKIVLIFEREENVESLSGKWILFRVEKGGSQLLGPKDLNRLYECWTFTSERATFECQDETLFSKYELTSASGEKVIRLEDNGTQMLIPYSFTKDGLLVMPGQSLPSISKGSKNVTHVYKRVER